MDDLSESEGASASHLGCSTAPNTSSASFSPHIGLRETDSDGTTSPSPPKKKRYSCVFCEHHCKEFPWATDSMKGTSFAFCMRCNRDISLGQGGTKDPRRHQETMLHLRSKKSSVGSMSLRSYFGSVRGRQVLEAEIKFGYFLGERHLAFRLPDHASKLFPSMFPDSAVAKDFKCSRTKTTAVLKVITKIFVTAPNKIDHLAAFFKIDFFAWVNGLFFLYLNIFLLLQSGYPLLSYKRLNWTSHKKIFFSTCRKKFYRILLSIEFQTLPAVFQGRYQVRKLLALCFGS